MATSFGVVYNRFLSKITDYDFLSYDEEVVEELLEEYLHSAVVSFQHICKTDLGNTDWQEGSFLEDLEDEVIEILAVGMSYYWLEPYVKNSENLRNSLNTKDFSQYSSSELLYRAQCLRDTTWSDFRNRIVDYSYSNANVSELL